MVGGNKDWVDKGLNAVPKKLQMISNLNTILAYKPWTLLTKESKYMMSLLNNKNKKERWSNKELLHAGMVLILYHNLSGLINSC